MKRHISVLLLSAILLSAASCGKADNSEFTESTSDDTSSEVITTDSFDPGLPDLTFDGYTFTFAVRGTEGGNGTWDGTDILADSQTGDILDDAMYKRNLFMNDKYGVTINAIFCGDTSVSVTGSVMSQFIGKSIMSGDSEFDAILSSPYDSIGYVMNDWVKDLSEIEYIDLSRSWWDQNVSRDLAFGSKMYMATGDITFVEDKATHVMIFDKSLVRDYGIDDPYKDVKDGVWTIDKFISNCKMVTSDLDGDGEMGKNDRYGYTYWQDAVFSLIYSTGNSFGQIKNGTPEVTFYTERLTETWSKLIPFISGGDALSVKDHIKEFDVGGDVCAMIGKLLTKHQTLYSYANIAYVIDLRSNDTDFGIIPNPKFDEKQETYITAPHAYGYTMLTVPVTVKDDSRTGFIIEAFAAKSAEVVTPAFYEKTLVGKSTRDDESIEMLDYIFANKHYDIGQFFVWGDITNKVMDAWNKRNENITSVYKSLEEAAKEDAKKTAELLK